MTVSDTPLSDRLRGPSILRLERLERLEGPSREADADIYIALFIPAERVGRIDRLGGCVGWWPKDAPYVSAIDVPAYTASLDAVVALAERLGFQWLKKSQEAMTVYRPLTPEQDERKEWAVHYGGTGATPAIALVIATLRALSQEQSK